MNTFITSPLRSLLQATDSSTRCVSWAAGPTGDTVSGTSQTCCTCTATRRAGIMTCTATKWAGIMT